jgi:hypothetical protein
MRTTEHRFKRPTTRRPTPDVMVIPREGTLPRFRLFNGAA